VQIPVKIHRQDLSIRISAALLALFPLMLVTGCSDDDDDSDPPPPPEPRQSQFSASLDPSQEVPAPVQGTRVRVTVTNLAPATGTFQMPVWIGLHDGTFELFDLGSPAELFFPVTNALERLAEDGNFAPLASDFRTQAIGNAEGALSGELGPEAGPIAPGETVVRVFEVDPASAESRYLSYASMVIPSNDAFVANDDPLAHELFDAGGNFVATDFVVLGNQVLDAGTEVNDEVPANTAFFGQTVPNTGTAESGNVTLHAGFLAAGMGGILDDPMFANADFTAPGYQLLAFQFDVLPPATVGATGVASVVLTSNDALVDFTVSAAGLSGTVTGAHIHTGEVGMTGPVALDLMGGSTVNSDGIFVASGSLPISAGLVTEMREGNTYINLHTDLNPTGEIRGQIATGTSFTGSIDSAQEVPTPVLGREVRVVVRNNAPANGTFQTPIWIGFHDGGFDTHDPAMPANLYFPGSNALERLAEDGDTEPLAEEFTTQGFGTVQGILRGVLGPEDGPIAPGETVSAKFRVDPDAAGSQFLSYATMIIPSNDAFLSNGDPLVHPAFDVSGVFMGMDFIVPGSAALDAGTEVNDEIPANTGFFGQTVPDTGVPEGGNVAAHPGFLAPGMGGILDNPMFVNADFTAPGYEFLDVRLSDSEPSSTPTGLVVATLNMDSTALQFSVQAIGLSGPVTEMHFHEAAAGTAGPVVIDIASSILLNEGGVLTAQGIQSVTSDFVAALRNGNIYVNLHTALNPTGEARGQIRLIE
jgi:hypothetical protein